MRRRRVIWVMLACLLAPVALYALLPTAAAAGLTYFLHRQGYQHITVQLGYPGWHTLQVPVLSFQKDLDGESLSVTVQDSRLQYDIGVIVLWPCPSPYHPRRICVLTRTRWERWPGMWAIPDSNSRARPIGQCNRWTSPATSAGTALARTRGRAGARVPRVRHRLPARCPHLRDITQDRCVSRWHGRVPGRRERGLSFDVRRVTSGQS